MYDHQLHPSFFLSFLPHIIIMLASTYASKSLPNKIQKKKKEMRITTSRLFSTTSLAYALTSLLIQVLTYDLHPLYALHCMHLLSCNLPPPKSKKGNAAPKVGLQNG